MPRRTPRRRGANTILTPTRQRHLLDHIANGQHITTACQLVGIHPSTIYVWTRKGEEAKAAAANGTPTPPDKRVYVDFFDALALARGKAEKRAMDTVRRSMEGGFVVSEEPVVDAEGTVQTDPVSGEVLWKRSFTQPDGRLALEYLARMDPGRFGRNPTRVELAGPGGGAVSVERSVVVASLAERLAAVRAARAAERELEAGDVVEGELVDADPAAGGGEDDAGGDADDDPRGV